MAITFKAEATGSGFTSSASTSAGVNVAVGDLIVIGVGTNDSTILCTGVTDTAGNSYTLRDSIVAGNSNVRIAWVIATAAHASNIFTASFNAGSTTKWINTAVFSIDAGDTVSLDIVTSLSNSWLASPWATGTDTTTGDDVVAVAFFDSSTTKTYSNQEIPSGTAAIVLTAAVGQSTFFYRILTATATIGAETDVSATGAVSAEMVVFKAVGAGNPITISAETDIPFIRRYRI